MRNAQNQWVDKMGRSLAPGRSRTAEHATVRVRSKHNKPLPLHLMCHAPKAKRTYTEVNPVHNRHPQLEALGLEGCIARLNPPTKRKVPYTLVSRSRGVLGWTGEERLMRTICRLGNDIYKV